MTRENPERSAAPPTAFATRPPIPACRARSPASCVGCLGRDPEPDHRDEHVRHEEQEDPERHRAGEHDSAGGDVAVDGAEPGVDEGRVGARPLEPLASVLDALREPRLLVFSLAGRAVVRATATGCLASSGAGFRRFPGGLHRATVDQAGV